MFSSINNNIRESDAAFNRVLQRSLAIAANSPRQRTISDEPVASGSSPQVRMDADADKVIGRPRSSTIPDRLSSLNTSANTAQRRKAMDGLETKADPAMELRVALRPGRLSTVEEPDPAQLQYPQDPASGTTSKHPDFFPVQRHSPGWMSDTALEMASEEPGAHFPLKRMTLLLNDIFAPFINPQNKAAIAILINQRLSVLKNMEIGPEELVHRLENATRVDNLNALIRGAIASVGFIAGTQAAGTLTAILHERYPGPWVPLVPGATIGLVDQLYGGFLQRTRVDYYLQPASHLLERTMEECLASRRRSLMEECGHQAIMLTIPFSIRNVLRTVVSPLAGTLGNAEQVDTLIDGLGGLPAGAASEFLRGLRNREREFASPAYLLAARDWKEQLASLQHGPWSGYRARDIALRTCNKITDLPSLLWTGLKRPFSIDGLTEIVTLSVGLAVIDRSKQWMTSSVSYTSALARDFMKSAIGTVSLAGLYYTLGINMTLAARPGDVYTAAKSHIQTACNTCRNFFCSWFSGDANTGEPQDESVNGTAAENATATDPAPLSVSININ